MGLELAITTVAMMMLQKCGRVEVEVRVVGSVFEWGVMATAGTLTFSPRVIAVGEGENAATGRPALASSIHTDATKTPKRFTTVVAVIMLAFVEPSLELRWP